MNGSFSDWNVIGLRSTKRVESEGNYPSIRNERLDTLKPIAEGAKPLNSETENSNALLISDATLYCVFVWAAAQTKAFDERLAKLEAALASK